MIDCHLHLSRAPDSGQLLQELRPQLEALITAECSMAEVRRLPGLLRSWGAGVYAFVGTHPLAAGGFDPQLCARLLGERQVLGIGECGLDRRGPLSEQQPLLRAQLTLACDLAVPICLHAVGYQRECLETLRPFKGRLRGFVHDFGGSYELYCCYARLGLKISLSPRVRRRGQRTLEALRRAAPDDLLLESDYDGRQAYSAAELERTAEWLAQLRGHDCRAALDNNARQVLTGEW